MQIPYIGAFCFCSGIKTNSNANIFTLNAMIKPPHSRPPLEPLGRFRSILLCESLSAEELLDETGNRSTFARHNKRTGGGREAFAAL